MVTPIVFKKCSGRVNDQGWAAPRLPVHILHTLPDVIRRQVHLANDDQSWRDLEALTLANGLPPLAWQCVHEVIGWSAMQFALTVAHRTHAQTQSHPIIIIGNAKDIRTLRPEAIGAYVPPGSVTLVEAARRADILWTAEQALSAKAQPLVIVQIDQGPNLSESRCLKIASERGGGMGLVLISGRAQSSACQTRWECNPASDGWDWSIVKNKIGPVGAWRIRAGPNVEIDVPIPLSTLPSILSESNDEPAPHIASVVSFPSP